MIIPIVNKEHIQELMSTVEMPHSVGINTKVLPSRYPLMGGVPQSWRKYLKRLKQISAKFLGK